MAELTDRIALVTGATGGLGPAVVEALRKAGAKTFGVGRSENAEIHADLTKAEGASEAVAAAGEVDILVLVMGGFAGGAPIQETDEAVWDKMMALNLKSAYLMMHAVLPGMIERGRGRIIAIGSQAGIANPAGLSAYAVSKAGVHALVEVAAKETEGSGVTVNAVLPGTIDTPANRRAMPEADTSSWVSPEAIAAQILYLASDAAAPVTGALIAI